MGDRIEDLPVDQIVPSTDEKQILDSMFVSSGPRPTASLRPPSTPATHSKTIPIGEYETTPDAKLNDNLMYAPPVASTQSSPVQGVQYSPPVQPPVNPLKQEFRSAVFLCLIFVVCSMPQTDKLLGSMMPFLQRSSISTLAFKSILFMMISYTMLNWEMISVRQ